MVQGTRVIEIIKTVSVRLLLIIPVLFLGALTSSVGHEYLVFMGYQAPSGFFGFALTEELLAWFLSSIFWSGLIYQTFGKKIDQIFIITIFVIVSWEYFSADNMTWQIYFGLIGVALLGNFLGYLLKLGRERWFEQK